MMPGITYRPVASMTAAPGGDGDVGAHGGDAAVADEHGAVRDRALRARR